MARVTVEDCIDKIPNRFQLVLLAAQRARNVSAGAALTIEKDNDKNPVIALRELAEETVEIELLEEHIIRNLQQFVESDEPLEDEISEIEKNVEKEDEVFGDTSVAPDSGMLSNVRFEDADDAIDEPT